MFAIVLFHAGFRNYETVMPLGSVHRHISVVSVGLLQSPNWCMEYLALLKYGVSAIRRLSGKYPAILNISRTGRVALMSLGSQSKETLLCNREQSLSRGASQSAVRRR
jgi:hypothetical protein